MKDKITIPDSPNIPGLTFRRFQGEADYPLMRSLIIESMRADQIVDQPTVEEVREWCTPSERFKPRQDLLFALAQGAGEQAVVAGFSRVDWYTGAEETRLYSQESFLLPEWRKPGFWSAMVRQNERRLQEVAADHPAVTRRAFQVRASASQTEWIATLEETGYRSVRRFTNMRHRLDKIIDWKLPVGLEIRPVQADQMRSIWEANRDLELEVFETNAERWTEERYRAWLEDPSHTPKLWQVAWEGEQLVGMVLNHINENENQVTGAKRGYTEHVFIRKAWRRRGLAITLLSRSLHLLKDQGMEEAVLGVDMQNASGAYEFYQKMGYQTFSTDIWYRKPME